MNRIIGMNTPYRSNPSEASDLSPQTNQTPSRITKQRGNSLISASPSANSVNSTKKTTEEGKINDAPIIQDLPQENPPNIESSSNQENQHIQTSNDNLQQTNPILVNNQTISKHSSPKKSPKKDQKLLPRQSTTNSLKNRKPAKNGNVSMTVFVEPPILYFDSKNKDETDDEENEFDKNKELSYNELVKIYGQLRADYKTKVKRFKITLQKAEELNYDISVLKAQIDELQAQQAIIDKEFVALGLSSQT